MNQSDFELCSYFLSGAKCDNYGAHYCKMCDRSYCSEHKCAHLQSWDISGDSERDESFDLQGRRKYVLDSIQQEKFSLYDIDLDLDLYSVADLRMYRDLLFNRLKCIQTELDLREGSAAIIARETSTANLDNWLKEQGYGEVNRQSKTRSKYFRSSIASNRRRISRVSGRSNSNSQNSKNRSIEKTIKSLFENFSKDQIKAFVQKYGK